MAGANRGVSSFTETVRERRGEKRKARRGQVTGLFEAADGSWHAGPDTELHQFTYDENGQKSSYTDPLSRQTTYEYDLRNRLWKTNETVNTIPRTTETLYDTTGNKTLVKFPVESSGQRTQQWLDYDAFGQPGRFIDERNNTTNLTYVWGPMKKLYTVTTHRDKDSGGTENQLTTFSYDGMGKPTQVLFPDGSHENSTYECKDGVGYFCDQVHTWRTRKGQTKYIHYDARGREDSHAWGDLSATCNPGTDTAITPCVLRHWDDADRLTDIANRVSTIDYSYDSAGQVLWEGSTIAGSGGRAQAGYLRYPSGEFSQITYPYGRAFRHDYSARGQLNTTGVSDGNSNWIFQFINYYYLPDGKVDRQDYGNGMTTAFGYDGRGMIDWVRHQWSGNGPTLAYREYDRDERDRILWSVKGNAPNVNPRENGLGDVFYYDAEGQLTDSVHEAANYGGSPAGGQRWEHFDYDELGNRKGNNIVGLRGWLNFSRRDNGLNQYSSWSPSAITYDDTFYGTAGNGVLMQEGWITASYNALNQPVAIWSPAYNGTSNYMWFGYDPLGRCVKRWVGPSGATNSNPATYMYYDGWNLLQEGSANSLVWNGSGLVPGNGGADRVYVHGARVDELVISTNQGTGAVAFYHYDARGNCMLLTGWGANMMEQYEYDGFGKPYFYDASNGWTGDIGSSTFGNRFLFTGREWLSDLHLYDYRNRMYQPELGRFLQPDSKEFEAGDYNLYRYCHNDPVNKSDPFGLEFFPYNGPAIPVDQLYGGAGLGQSLVNPQVVVVSQPDGTSTLRLDVRVTGILVADRVKFHGKMETRSDKQKDVTFKEHEKGEHGKDWKGFHDEKQKEVPTTRFNDRDAAKEAAKGLTDKFRSDAFKANKEFEKHKPDERWKDIRDRELPR
jgi:RHS repeat-associated protein